MAKRRDKVGLPSREDILAFIAASPQPVGKREIARHFKIGPADRVALKGLLRDIERSGAAERGVKRRLGSPGRLPEVAVLELTEIDLDGEALAQPVGWPGPGAPPRIYVAEERKAAAPGVGERFLARLSRNPDGAYEARVLRLLTSHPEQVLGVFRATGEGGLLVPTDRKQKSEFLVLLADAGGASDGDLVLGEILPARRLGMPQARIIERLGDTADPGAISLIAIHTHDIPVVFSREAVAEAEAAQPVTPAGREDLRDIPLVTIDGSDARDFDDAVWAAPDGPTNPGGWHVLVAIADVSWYVRPGSALDRDARERGNSVYFPDRVVPMLPEALSNELCSLKPDVERACLAVHMWFDAEGKKLRHRFVRGLMRSAARLTYEQVQQAADGRADRAARTLADPVLAPLYGAWRALDGARRRRGALELDLPERRVVLGPDRRIQAIVPRERLDSHRLIEEFMIAANVAAAETLERVRKPCMYRVHDAPDPMKIEALRSFLEELGVAGVKLAKGQVVRPRHFNQILAKLAATPFARIVSELVLRSQAQAVYSPENLGHFGLGLARYAHFTSPIRRYADLLVHRALVGGLGFGEGGLPPEEDVKRFVELGEHISATERRAAAAERSALDRYAAAFLAERVGAEFAGRINGVTRFGLFVTLNDTGADGLVPIRSLPTDFYHHDEANHRLVGRRWGRVYTLGEPVTARVVEANPLTGSIVFELVGEAADPAPGKGARTTSRRGRQKEGRAQRRSPRSRRAKSSK